MNDGQHRRAAIGSAFKRNRAPGKEKILVHLFESPCVCGFEGERVIEERSC
jgi:hypothetical protein